MTRSRPSVDRMLSASVHGTVLVVAGGAVVAVGLLYGLAVGLTELLPSPAGPTPAGNGSVFGTVAVVLLLGATVATLGAQLVGYSR